jgi:pyrroline-5-carboxylate reductase
MPDCQLGVIGAGNMAEAVLRGVIRGNLLPHGAIIASDPVFDRRQNMARNVGVTCVQSNLIPAACPRVLLAVKPQTMAQVLEEIAPVVRAEATVISIAAGIATGFLDERLGGRGHIVRVMPNTPMVVGAGVAALAAGPRATGDDVQWTQKLFAASGQTCVVAEPLLDAVTAVSGSGPAYVFYLVEAMIAAGVAEGLSPEVARMLAVHTCGGAARLLSETGQAPEVLRAKVTSPGGTTQRAIETMESAGVKARLIEAIRAAAERSRELGR